MKKEKILITVKTYPTKSKKYQELVCTAGLKEDGGWVRIYPIPFKSIKEYEGLKKYTWIEAQIEKDTRDPRPDSYKINTSSIKIDNTIDTSDSWKHRKDIVFKSNIYEDLGEIIELANKEHSLSLCTFKPKEFIKVHLEQREIKEWDEVERKKYINANANLFENQSCGTEFNAMPEIPYKFKIEFKDIKGKVSKMSILDWEISQFYLNLKNRKNDQKEIEDKIRDKLNDMMFKRDLYLFLGTMRQMHGWTSNPFTIIGLFYPPKDIGYTEPLFSV